MRKQLIIAVIACLACLLSASTAFSEQSSRRSGTATLSFSGSGNGPIEVRGANGKIQEILDPSDMRLNQPPAHVIEREKAYRAKRKADAKANNERKAEKRKAAAEEADKAAQFAEEQRIADNEKTTRLAVEQAEKPLNPYKVRRRTVRRKIEEPATTDN